MFGTYLHDKFNNALFTELINIALLKVSNNESFKSYIRSKNNY